MVTGQRFMASSGISARELRSNGTNGAPAATREVPIQVMVPESVRRQVAMMGADRGENMRTLVLRGLQAIGIDVPESELGDRRGRRRIQAEDNNGTK